MKIFHFDSLRCDTQVICQIAVALLKKYKYCQENEALAILNSFPLLFSNA